MTLPPSPLPSSSHAARGNTSLASSSLVTYWAPEERDHPEQVEEEQAHIHWDPSPTRDHDSIDGSDTNLGADEEEVMERLALARVGFGEEAEAEAVLCARA